MAAGSAALGLARIATRRRLPWRDCVPRGLLGGTGLELHEAWTPGPRRPGPTGRPERADGCCDPTVVDPSQQASPTATPKVWAGPIEVSLGSSSLAPRHAGTGSLWFGRHHGQLPAPLPRPDAGAGAAVRSPPFRSFANAAGAGDQEARWERGLELLQSIKVRDEDLAEELARGDADLGAADQFGSTPLVLAARAGMQHLSKVLIELPGVDVNASNHFGSTALVCAATNGHLEVCEMLLRHGADVNHRTRLGGTALGKAAGSGQEAVCRRLLEAGAKLDVRTKLGDDAADLARKGGHEELAKLLAKSA